jgi:photosystem II stability/assembly factor-like uncharacterized protein
MSCDAYAQWNAAQLDGTKANLRGIHNAGNHIMWASGSEGTVLHSVDDGAVWQKCSVPPSAEKLDFRAVWGWDAKHALAMSSGTGDASRLYETIDGCATWHLRLANPDGAGFWDGLVFAGSYGLLVGDPVDGRFTTFATADGGQHWSRETGAEFASDGKGEGIFAASNSALTIRPPGPNFVFGTGGIGGPRVFTTLRFRRSNQQKNSSSWTRTRAPLATGAESAGIFSLAFRNRQVGIAVGGDYKRPQAREGTAAFTSDGGAHWTPSAVLPSGYRSAVAWELNCNCWVAVGTNGSDVSFDDGKTWRPFDSGNWNALSLPWTVGPGGRIARLDGNVLARLSPDRHK